MRGHPADSELLDVCEGGAGSAASRVAAHLDGGCRRCEERLRQYRELLASLTTPPMDAVPEEWIQGALRRIRSASSESALEGGRAPAGLVQKAREIVMALRLDTLLTPALAGVRGPAGTGRRIIYEDASAILHLQVRTAKPGTHDLIGQLVPSSEELDLSRLRVRLLKGGRAARAEALPTGEFRLTGVRGKTVELRIECGGIAFRAGPMELETNASM